MCDNIDIDSAFKEEKLAKKKQQHQQLENGLHNSFSNGRGVEYPETEPGYGSSKVRDSASSYYPADAEEAFEGILLETLEEQIQELTSSLIALEDAFASTDRKLALAGF